MAAGYSNIDDSNNNVESSDEETDYDDKKKINLKLNGPIDNDSLNEDMGVEMVLMNQVVPDEEVMESEDEIDTSLNDPPPSYSELFPENENLPEGGVDVDAGNTQPNPKNKGNVENRRRITLLQDCFQFWFLECNVVAVVYGFIIIAAIYIMFSHSY